MKNKKYPCQKICSNGGEGCGTIDHKSCVRFMPLEGNNLTEIIGFVETPPDIDYDKFSQYFCNWIDSMGWSFCGHFHRYEEKKDG